MAQGAKRRSKLDPYLDQLGKVPDAELAAIAGVTAENVRAYRLRRRIPAAWRGDGVGSRVTAEAAEVATPRPRAKSGAARRRSRPATETGRGALSRYREQIGILTDARIGDLAGTNSGNVRSYRLRHGIPARWRGEGDPLPNEEAIKLLDAGLGAAGPQEVHVEIPPTEEPSWAAVAAVMPAAPSEPVASTPLTRGYEVQLLGPAGEARFVVVGQDIADAARKAVRSLAPSGQEGRVVSLRFIANLLSM